MKQYLLPENGNFYKANLHCHTVISDGEATPEQIKEIYKRHGYSVVAFTDHNVQVPHPELRDADFLPLTGTEYNLNAPGYPGKIREVKTCHLCFIASRDDIPYQVCYTDSYVRHGSARDYIPQSQIDPNEPDFPREHTPECVNKMIKADELEYNTIGKALLDGNFYASTGPGINALWFDGVKLHIECSEAESVSLIYGVKKANRHAVPDGGEPITSTDFEINPNCWWFRIHVEDGHGHFADTRAYYMSELAFGETE